MSLRDALLASLADVPGTREFHIHVLVSSPRKRSDIYPYAIPRPKVYLQDILILLSEQPPLSASRVLTTAIEASFHNIPATSCGILYVSKVDSSGHAAKPSPTTALVKGLLGFYADPSARPTHVDHLWIQLFARAQGQYLFPNSADFPGKRPLADLQLCSWWKHVLSDTAATTLSREKGPPNVKLFYVLPGLSELEATHALNAARATPSAHASLSWIYGHPYNQSEIPLPCPPIKNNARRNLGHFIPSFDDDPKSRFMDEIAHTMNADAVSSPKRKKPRPPDSRASDRGADDNAATEEVQGELSKVSPDEFWERMSFRQECISGVVTAFFALGISGPGGPDQSAGAVSHSPLAPQPGQVAPRMVERVIATLMNHHEFSTRERALRATETLEGAIKGLCEDLAAVPSSPTLTRHSVREATPEPGPSHLEVPKTPPRRAAQLPDISPNPFPEPVASLETYHSFIYGSVAVDNPLPPPKDAAATGAQGAGAGGERAAGPQVTMLTARKKRKTPS
ncbi:predicted protein [Postia placenta Mad-698-R]|uniref:histone acetyltransferase n=1 Tax=Postia placenta MAD-698-R-SB12 TaxID=670580 RepID=A0A1X6MUF1_9APHY|nr:hypothetical protein POSPLADRAFT_1172275 [Postia placenta MAD-698-R-SB12]EED81029.1 predicted protein [Postia placenta Mad-698-R]OSX59988.1 hypothetical protein POSPLADRAFT_1172275 [Postia placenta MAD-698-R-SB12]